MSGFTRSCTTASGACFVAAGRGIKSVLGSFQTKHTTAATGCLLLFPLITLFVWLFQAVLLIAIAVLVAAPCLALGGFFGILALVGAGIDGTRGRKNGDPSSATGSASLPTTAATSPTRAPTPGPQVRQTAVQPAHTPTAFAPPPPRPTTTSQPPPRPPPTSATPLTRPILVPPPPPPPPPATPPTRPIYVPPRPPR